MAVLATSQHRGVYWHTRASKWAAQAQANGRPMFLGFHDREEDAAQAVAAYHRDRMHGLRKDASWQELVVACLSESKRRGRAFAVAREIAERDHPPRARDIGSSATLFDESGESEETPYEAFWRFCEAEYNGRPTTRERFSLDLLAAPDWSRPAVVASRVAA